jgi:Uma2 family endonuclease
MLANRRGERPGFSLRVFGTGRGFLVMEIYSTRRIVGRAELHFSRRTAQTMAMPATERSWTRAEVLDLIARNPLSTPRYELVDGVLLVTPAPSRLHQVAVGLMFRLLADYLDSEPGVGQALTSPADVMPEPGVTVGPDVFVMLPDEAKRIHDKGPIRGLLLTVEVLSPGDRSGDRGRKRALYQRAIPEYWIVDTTERCIEVWRQGAADAVTVRDRLTWHPAGAVTPFALDVPRYFARVYGENR